MSVAVVIPAFNEAPTVRGVVERALRKADRIIVVDDGSSDGTGDALRGLPVTVMRNPVNLGKAASLRRGMSSALAEGASAVVTLDADGQHEPEDIPRLLAAHARNPQAIIIGARLHDKSRIPRSRYLANRFGNFWVAWAAGYPISDSQSGFRLYPASVLGAIDVHNDRSRGFVFESAVLINAARAGFMSQAVAISALYPSGRRRSHFRPVLDFLLIGRMIWWKLLTRGFDIPGLLRSRRCADRSQQSHNGVRE